MKATSQTSAKFDHFVQQLSLAIEQPNGTSTKTTTLPRLLDGAATDAARTLLPLAFRQQHGIFFSGHELAGRVASPLHRELADGATVFDPACGAGDLLIAAARHLPLQRSIADTLATWTNTIGGADIHQEFVLAARMRLLLLARLRHTERGDADCSIALEPWMFANVECADYLANGALGSDYSCVVANPPFGDSVAPAGCTWSSGKTQLAAVFLEQVLSRARSGQRISAILPDVLRSGTRYGRWRQRIESLTSGGTIAPYGRFDPNTDVDVFLLDLHAGTTDGAREDLWPQFQAPAGVTKLGELFEVRIGPVVPHRHKNTGQWAPYLCAKTAPAFSEVEPTSKKRFAGPLIAPPFVAIRRTSNPADERRLVPTIVTGTRPVAVENHLIALIPKSGQLSACKQLYADLLHPETRVWIDNAIRCRHLTKKVLVEMPISSTAI